MRGHSLILVATLVAWSVTTPALAEDDAAWEAYFGSMDEGEAEAALDTLERDRAEAEAAEVATREEEARLKKEERRRARAERKAKRDRKKSSAKDEKAEETVEVTAAATVADEADAITETTGEELAAEGASALADALPLLTASSVASLESEPLRLFDSADSSEHSFPWGRWLAINLALAVLLGGAVYGAKKGKLAHWLKRARLPRAARVAPELSVSATHNLAHGQAIHLIEGGDFRLVVGSWPGGMTRLATLPAIDGAVAQAVTEELAPALPAGAGMTADDEVEEASVAAAAIDEVELAAEGVGVKVDIGTYDSWFDEESKADGDGPVTVDDDEMPTIKELAFPEVLRQAASGALNAGPRMAGPRAVGLFRAGDEDAAADADPDHESLAEQVLARVREMRASR
jgi:flagellar biogenesis protein FliO